MEKLEGKTIDVVKDNVEKLQELFPEVFTEQKIDFEKLKIALGDRVQSEKERYEFTWNGKTEAIQMAQKQSTGTLRPCKEESVEWDTTQNLYIEGDNLEVLRLLQNSYRDKVKMIYIDPPYNTGKDFVYKDNFHNNIKNYTEMMEESYKSNAETNGRYHTDWLNMIYPRLKLAKSLLKDDGVIFVSIDDSEQSNLKKIMDEIFGEANFIASVTRNTNSAKNQAIFFSVSHDYCLVYAKNIGSLNVKYAENKWAVAKNNVNDYLRKIEELRNMNLSHDEITEELKQITKYPRFTDFVNYWYMDDKGVYQKDNLGGVKNGNMVTIMNPLTLMEDPIPPGGFRYSAEKLQQLIEEDRIHFHTDGSLPRLKRYLTDNLEQRPKSIMSDDQRPDYSLLKEFNTPFDNPKQLSFIKRLLSIFENDEIYLDFFSGSATTAHAVMDLNAADGGSRKFIMVQIPETTDEKSDAYKAGYTNICEIGKERIRRAGLKVKEENKDKDGLDNLDIGFKVFKLDETNLKTWDEDAENIENNLLFFEGAVKEGRTQEDVLYEILLKYGIPLTVPMEEEKVGDITSFSVGFGYLVICLDKNLTTKNIEELVLHYPECKRMVFLDDGFASDEAKINAEQLLKRSGVDDIRVI
ncbi:site-specific DNA-methyltransferase [Psychrobacillus sp. FSL H8-0484]|uniref:site-specific DNA-methyltransferase n=1 Tax=Psychrobacillus sp. FSL H8-0484 TaxID=2921390 RepID=UPI0030F5F4ED